MCVPYSLRDPKARRLMVIGNLSLVAALLFWQFARPSGATAREWSDGLCGLLAGLSIGINLWAVRRRCSTG
jgi:hypothetical protein